MGINPSTPLFHIVPKDYPDGGTPRIVVLSKLRCWQFVIKHQVAHAPRPLVRHFDELEVVKRLHQIWISRRMEIVYVVFCDKWRERPRAFDNQPVIKHLDEDRDILHPITIRSVRACVDDRLVPRKLGVFRRSVELPARTQPREFAKLGLQHYICFLEQGWNWTVDEFVFYRVPVLSSPFRFAFKP